MRNYKVILLLTAFILIFLLNYQIRAEMNFDLWPKVEYFMESKTHIFETTVERLYVGRRAIRIEEDNTVILKFKEDGVTQIILSDEENEKTYELTELSYDEFLNEYGEFASFFAEVMPGQKDGDPDLVKDGEEYFLNREVEHWYYLEDESDTGGRADLLLDRELKQVVKMSIDGQVFTEAVEIEVKKLSPELFDPPAGYERIS